MGSTKSKKSGTKKSKASSCLAGCAVGWAAFSAAENDEKTHSLIRNQKVVVASNAPFHANRVGFFQFDGDAGIYDLAVLSIRPIDMGDDPSDFFIVNTEDLEMVVPNAT